MATVDPAKRLSSNCRTSHRRRRCRPSPGQASAGWPTSLSRVQKLGLEARGAVLGGSLPSSTARTTATGKPRLAEPTFTLTYVLLGQGGDDNESKTMSQRQALVAGQLRDADELEPASGPRKRGGRRSTSFCGHCVEDCSNNHTELPFYNIGGRDEWYVQ